MIFRNWVLNNFPFLEDDFDALTDYELFCKMVEYMKKSLDEIKEFQVQLDSFNQKLNDFQNYFDTLDVQEEINNKLDEMADSGELTDIIAQYLQLAGVLAYDTLSDLVSAENIVNGSITRTLGNLTYNDGKGSFYKIRTITSGDVVDGVNIVALNVSDTLIAEKIGDYYVNQNTTNITTNANNIDTLLNRKVLCVGDSYGSGEIGSSWANNVIDMLTTSGYGNGVNLCVSGAGFSVTDNKYIDQLVDYVAEHDDLDKITDIIVAGGYNDNGISYESVTADMEDFIAYCKTHFPNAKIRVAYLGWKEKQDSSKYAALYSTYLIYSLCQYMGATYIKDSELVMHNYSFFNETWDGGFDNAMHPNSNGNSFIASVIYNALFNTEYNACIKRTTNLTGKMAMESWISDKTEYLAFVERGSDPTSSQYGCEFNSDLDGFETSVAADKWCKLLAFTPFKDRYVNGGNSDIKVVGTTVAKITKADTTVIYMPTVLCALYGNLYMKNCSGSSLSITKVEIPTTILKGEIWTG